MDLLDSPSFNVVLAHSSSRSFEVSLFIFPSDSDRPIAIYGTGGFASCLIALLSRCDRGVERVFDGDETRWGESFHGIRIENPEALRDWKRGDGILVVASSAFREIGLRLEDLGLREGEDFVDGVRFAMESEYLAQQVGLSSLRGCHRGRRAFLVGNGPSLTMEDLDRLNGEICFAANKIFLAYEATDWRPRYYCCCDPQVSINIRDRIRDLDATKFLANATCFYGERVENGFVLPYYYRNRPPMGDRPRFSVDPASGLYDGGTVIYMMMQLAYFMGVRELYLIGVDHSFSLPAGAEGALLPGGGDNHFHPDYRPEGEKWCRPDFAYVNRAFEYARDFLDQRGVKVINVSRRSALDVFPRADLESVLGG